MKLTPLVLAIALIASPALTAEGESSLLAISGSERLASSGVGDAPENTWVHPNTSDTKRAYQDVRIGSPRTGADSVDLDYHRGTGNLFAAVAWGDAWTLNISTDGGASWQETYEYSAESVISMRVGGDYVWVAYSASPVPSTLRMRRFFAETGLSDTTYDYQSIGNVHPATVVDVAMTSNAYDSDSSIYIACMASDGTVEFYLDELDGTSFDPFHPSITNADGSLDITYNPGGISGYFVFISYRVGTYVHVGRLHVFGGWEDSLLSVINGTNNYTAISAYQDIVATVIETDTTYGNAVTQFTNTDAGTGSWTYETVHYPVTPDSPEAASGDISLRSPFGSAVTYQLEDGTFDKVNYRHRQGHGLGLWGDASTINEVDSASLEQTTVEWLGAGCVSSYGVVYVSGADFAPYFDLVTPRGFFCDGFESGSTSVWD